MDNSAAPNWLERSDGLKLAVRHRPGDATKPTLVFLPGYASDMQGGKAVALDGWAAASGLAMLRLDYAGCGESEGDFADGTLAMWRDDALLAIKSLVGGPVLLIGSSMGGWLALLIAQALGAQVAGLVGIAAAPDFTRWGFDEADKQILMAEGRLLRPSDYGPEPMLTTLGVWGDEKMLAEEGRYVIRRGTGDEADRGKYLVLWKREGGRWRLFRDCFNSDLPAAGATSFIRQQSPHGLGHAVWCARDLVGDEPFAVLLADELLWNPARPCLKQMVDTYEARGGNVIAVLEVPEEHTNRYGIVDPGATEGSVTEVKGFVEKPKLGTAPSRLAAVGRYIIQPEVFALLGEGARGAGGEIQLTDALARMIGKTPFHAHSFDGVRHDCGDKAGFIQANIALALERADLEPSIREFLKTL